MRLEDVLAGQSPAPTYPDALALTVPSLNGVPAEARSQYVPDGAGYRLSYITLSDSVSQRAHVDAIASGALPVRPKGWQPQ